MVELVRYLAVTPYEYVRSLVRFYHNLFVQCFLVYAIAMPMRFNPHATKLVLSFYLLVKPKSWSSDKIKVNTLYYFIYSQFLFFFPPRRFNIMLWLQERIIYWLKYTNNINFIFSNFNTYNSISENFKICQFNSIVCPTLTQIPYSPIKLKKDISPFIKND